MKATATYAYCVVKGAPPPALEAAPPGMPGGGHPRAVKGAGVSWIVVSDVPLDAYNAASIDRHLQDLDWVAARAMAHEAVVEFCSRTRDVIPMKLFTIFRDERRAASHVGSSRDLAAIFRRIGGCAEWSVRLSCAASREAARQTRARPGRGAHESGTAFLLRKKAERERAQTAAAAASRTVEDLYRRLSRIAKRSVRKEGDVPGTGLLLDAAFLVPRRKQAAFAREVKRRAATAARTGCDLVMSGPWPAYHFVGGAK